MRKIILYIACSIDGFIARKNGDVDWLPEGGDDYGYSDFYKSIDTVIMGNSTYQKVLSFGGEYHYKDKINYVFTRNSTLDKDENVEFILQDMVQFTRDLKKSEGGDIWLVGGGEVFSKLFKEKLVDELMIFVVPKAIGTGIRLFRTFGNEIDLKLKASKKYKSGIVLLHYQTEQ